LSKIPRVKTEMIYIAVYKIIKYWLILGISRSTSSCMNILDPWNCQKWEWFIPIDFSWGGGGGGGRKSKKNVLNWREKNEHQHHQKKYRAQKISKLAILYIERKMLQPDFWFWILVVALQHPWVKNEIWTIFFTKAKGTLPPEKGHFLCLLKTWGGLGPPVPTPLYILGTLIWLGTVRICI
jgi:hypothetical protein